jgi:amino-acid N-acetyltransferase
MIRKARVVDVKEIRRILRVFANRGELLLRTMAELYSQVRDYYVYQEKGEGPLWGIAALHVSWDDLGEIRSLAVLEEYQRRGIGTKLVEACLSEALTLGLERVFVLTYRPDFFGRFGFKVVDKNVLLILSGPTASVVPNFRIAMR